MKKQSELSLAEKAMQALTEAVAKVVEDHRRRGKPLAVWRDGKAVWISAEEAAPIRKTRLPRRTKSHGASSRDVSDASPPSH